MLVWIAALALAVSADAPAQHDLFVSGTEGYHTFRIPSLLRTPKGTLLAFCEGRKRGRGDAGDIDVVLKRSTDGGKTWRPLQVVADDGANTVGNPCPVVDRKTGTIYLWLTWNHGKDTEKLIRDGTSKDVRRAWLMTSKDEGATWSKHEDLTKDVKDPKWTWYATGPGIGVQLASGRLVIPCDHTEAGTRAMRSHVVVSDDGGKSWKVGGVLGDKTNECQVAERRDGTLLLSMRSYHGKNRRAVATSKDGGSTWSTVTLDDALIDPVCQASLISLGGDRMAFSNPASTKRERMTVRLSDDGGRTWDAGRVLHEGPAAYSCLAALPGGEVLCLYERGKKSPYEVITLARLGLGRPKER